MRGKSTVRFDAGLGMGLHARCRKSVAKFRTALFEVLTWLKVTLLACCDLQRFRPTWIRQRGIGDCFLFDFMQSFYHVTDSVSLCCIPHRMGSCQMGQWHRRTMTIPGLMMRRRKSSSRRPGRRRRAAGCCPQPAAMCHCS